MAINYTQDFVKLSLFNSKDLSLVKSVFSRIPLGLGTERKRIHLAKLIEYLESASKTDFIDELSPNGLISFGNNLSKVSVSGNNVPTFVRELSNSKGGEEKISLLKRRLIINWNLASISFIYGSKKEGGIEHFDLNYNSLVKVPGMIRLFRAYGFDKNDFANFLEAFPLIHKENRLFEFLFFGLLMEEVANRMKRKDKNWFQDIHEIILSGEYVSFHDDLSYLISLVGNSLGLVGIYEVITDKYNFFNSEDINLLKKTGEIANYLYVPTKLRSLEHNLVGDRGKARQKVLLEDEKIRLIEILNRDSLEVMGENKKSIQKVHLKGNLLLIDTRDFDTFHLIPLLERKRVRLEDIFEDWERGLKSIETKSGGGSQLKEVADVVNTDFQRMRFKKNLSFLEPINKETNVKASKGVYLKRGESFGKSQKVLKRKLLDMGGVLKARDEFVNLTNVLEGQNVRKGEVLAKRDVLFGIGRYTLRSPESGKVDLKNLDNGLIGLTVTKENMDAISRVEGTVQRVIPNKGMDMKVQALEVSLLKTTGKDAVGELALDFKKQIDDKILFIKNHIVSISELRKLLQLGIAGIIFESMDYANWLTLRAFLTESKLDVAVGVLIGFGKVEMPEELRRKLISLEKHTIEIDVKKRVMRIFVGGGEKFVIQDQEDLTVKKFESRDAVVSRGMSSWGMNGEIVSILEDSALVQFGKRDVQLTSLYNLE
ncbi:MAG TPA: hypothetical protein ENI13_01905 [candidate division CPR3 bacterium]|uniref:Uncharacterized protein n=1 Tax=candidate division CPR3 bacterium TaxID=2268181 RepID=A0A7C1NML3_UNCC3|nr:hypothetical protein [candidate division CPR3 bacterium]